MIAPAGRIIVTTPGTPVSAVVNLPTKPPHAPYTAHGVMFQALPANTGKVYIGALGMDIVAFDKLFAVLGIPTTTVIPSFSAALTISPNGMVLNQFYVDADVAGEGVILTYLQT